MKTAISIPDGLFAAADKLARRLGLSRSELYRTALVEYMVAHDQSQVTEQLDDIYREVGSSGLDPALARMQQASLVQQASLAKDDW